MRRLSLLAFGLAVTVVLVVAACGGDDSSGGSSELTKAEYIAAADAVCREADEKNDALAEPESLEDAEAVLRDGLEIFEEQLEGLEALTPPAEDSDAIGRAMELLGQVNETVAAAAEAFENGDVEEAVALLDGLDPIQAELDQIATDYGLDACRSGSAASG